MIMGFVFATVDHAGKPVQFYNTLDEARAAAKKQDGLSVRGLSIVDALNYLLRQELDLSQLQLFELDVP
jgi:hypothetical protein